MQYSYSGSMTQTDVYSYPTYPASPLPTVTTGAKIHGTVTFTMAPDPLVSGSTPTPKMATVEADAYPTQTQTMTTNSFYATNGTGPQIVSETGYTQTDDVGDTYSFARQQPAIVSQAPANDGVTWSDLPGGTLATSLVDGTTSTRTIANDGSYTDSESYQNDLQQVAIEEKADGSGSLDLSRTAQFGLHSHLRWDFSAPAKDPSTESPLITVTVSHQQDLATPGPVATVMVTPWYATPTAPYTDQSRVASGVTAPSECGLPPATPPLTEVTRLTNEVDTIIGTTTRSVGAQFLDANAHEVCATLDRDVKAYYDYNADTIITDYSNVFVFQGAAPLQETTYHAVIAVDPQFRSTLARATSARSTRASMTSSPQLLSELERRLEIASRRARLRRLDGLRRRLLSMHQDRGLSR